nr:unnamed protein product [Callosobruchus analis]
MGCRRPSAAIFVNRTAKYILHS